MYVISTAIFNLNFCKKTKTQKTPLNPQMSILENDLTIKLYDCILCLSKIFNLASYALPLDAKPLRTNLLFRETGISKDPFNRDTPSSLSFAFYTNVLGYGDIKFRE